MTDQRVKAALMALTEGQQKEIRDAYAAATWALASLVAALANAQQPDLAKELGIANEAMHTMQASSFGRTT